MRSKCFCVQFFRQPDSVPALGIFGSDNASAFMAGKLRGNGRGCLVMPLFHQTPKRLMSSDTRGRRAKG